jgi:hypothetical protein
MAGASETRRNPYPGPRAFEEHEQDLFFGRDEEVEILAGLVMARRASLLFAQSGAGKSSLLKAGLIPELTRSETVGRGPRTRTRQKMRVLPILTVGGAVPDGVEQPIANIYVFALSALLPEAIADELAPLSLTDALAPFFSTTASSDSPIPQFPDSPTSTLLIFDQFEELFTHHATRRQEREAFFQQVVQALAAYPTLHVLFSMREDYIAELTPYAVLLPEQLRPRFRLEFLDEKAARLAIQQPARREGVEMTETATTEMVNDLRRVRVLGRDGTMGEEPGPYVEPVQLQVVCCRLWEKLPRGATQIAEAKEVVGDVDSALADYYAERVAKVAAETGCSERAIRDWVDHQLITEHGIRGQVLQGPAQSQGLPNEAILLLVDAHLVRAEVRRGATWFELAHDRLVEPVRRNNADWRAARLNTLQRQASLWNSAQRPDGLLLRGRDLAEAEHWAAEHGSEVEEFERDFLVRSQDRHKVERRQKILAVGLAVMFLLALVAAISSGIQAGVARQQRETAVAALNAVATADSRAGGIEQTAAVYQNNAADAQALADQLRDTALAAGTVASAQQRQTADAQQATADAAQAAADQLRGTAEAASTAAVAAQQTAAAERARAITAVVTPQPTPLPTDTATSTAFLTPTPTTTDTPQPTATPRPARTATPRARPTTPVAVVCANEPVGIFAATWRTYRNRLGCPLQPEPVQFVVSAEEQFERGFMFWSAYTGKPNGLMLVLSRGAAPRWYEPANWSFDPNGAWCASDFPPPSGVIMPIRGFGGVWCDRKDIREALGWATDQEHNVDGVVQGFEQGFIFRAGDPKTFYTLFRDDWTYVEKTNP